MTTVELIHTVTKEPKGHSVMASENSAIRDHIQRTLDTINRVETSADANLRKQFCQMIGDQYEALIGLSVAELRQIAAMRENSR
jgi:hypothetical protein